MIQSNTTSCDMKTVQLFVDVGMQALCVQPESVWVRNSESELHAYTTQILKPDITDYADNEKNQISSLSATNQTALNNLTETVKADINETAQNQINYMNDFTDTTINTINTLSNTARNWAIGSIEEQSNGSSKYWAERANDIVNNIHPASETVAGLITLSTDSQAQTGTDDTTAMTPQKVMSHFVSLNTAQTISAVKTFTDDIKRTIDLDVTTAPASNKYKVPFQVLNSDETLRYYEQISYLTNGSLRQTCGLQRTVNGTRFGTSTILEIDANGNKSVLIDMTPATTSNNQQIATTAWVNTFCKTTNKIVTEWSGSNANSWYRKWSNGFIEQGGIVTGSVSGNNYNVSKTFYKPFTSMPCLTVTYLSTQGSGYNMTKNLTTTGFSFMATSTANNYQANSNGIAYYACGF